MKQKSWLPWSLVLLSLVCSLVVIGFPVLMIYPFREQTPLILSVAYTFRKISTAITLGSLFIVVFVLITKWRDSSIWKKCFGIFALLLVSAAIWFSRQNHFEWMFHPLVNPSYAHAGQANFIQPDDMVLAVEHQQDAAAYPVRFLAYHHLVQDVVGGMPIVATY